MHLRFFVYLRQPAGINFIEPASARSFIEGSTASVYHYSR